MRLQAVLLAVALVLLASPARGQDEYSISLDKQAAAAGRAMLKRALRDGIPDGQIRLHVGYREEGKNNVRAGVVIKALGAQELARWLGGPSEHITGKSVDFDLGPALTIANSQAHAFDGLPAYQWLVKHAHEFGFSHAFADDPWHFTHYLDPHSDGQPDPAAVRYGPRGFVIRPRGPDPNDQQQEVLRGGGVAWDRAADVIIYTQCWRVEGGGDGCVVKWEEIATHRIVRELPVFDLGDERVGQRTMKLQAARLALGQTKSIPRSVALVGREWPLSDPPSLELGDGLRITWSDREATLRVTGGAFGAGVTVAARRFGPWRPRPMAVFVADGAPIVVVELLHDPGEAFTDGANLVNLFEVIKAR